MLFTCRGVKFATLSFSTLGQKTLFGYQTLVFVDVGQHSLTPANIYMCLFSVAWLDHPGIISCHDRK